MSPQVLVHSLVGYCPTRSPPLSQHKAPRCGGPTCSGLRSLTPSPTPTHLCPSPPGFVVLLTWNFQSQGSASAVPSAIIARLLGIAASGLCSNGISKKGCPRLLCLEEQPHHSVCPSLHLFHVTSQHSDIYFFVSVALSPRTQTPGESGLCELCSLLYP